jgi:hypothetical protein
VVVEEGGGGGGLNFNLSLSFSRFTGQVHNELCTFALFFDGRLQGFDNLV